MCKYFCSIVDAILVCFTENEVDGATLLGLTDLMISRLLPTMKLQVKFNDLLRGLKLPVALPAETDGQPELMPTTSLAVRCVDE
jgi:hypothetical protein